MKNKKKTIEPRNPYALALASPIFRQKIKESKKRCYNRQKDKEELRKAVEENTTAFSFIQLPCLMVITFDIRQLFFSNFSV